MDTPSDKNPLDYLGPILGAVLVQTGGHRFYHELGGLIFLPPWQSAVVLVCVECNCNTIFIGMN